MGFKPQPRAPKPIAETVTQTLERVRALCSTHVHLNVHEPGPLPCLCRRCFRDQVSASSLDLNFVLDAAAGKGRVLLYWLPTELAGQRDKVRLGVEQQLSKRKPLSEPRP